MDDLTTLIILGAASFAGGIALVPLVRRVALRYDFVDGPRHDRLSQHATPYLGGVAIAATALVVSPFAPGWELEAGAVVLGALLVGTVGLIDDIRCLGPSSRLAVEVAAAAFAAAAGVRVQLFGGSIDVVLTVVWLVVITNSFNLLDNMDGAAGVIATVTGFALLTAATLEGQWLVAGLAAAVTGAVMGFLVHNWHPARIFMGDAGSLFLGYLLAAIALKLRFPVSESAAVPAVVLLTGPALFDTSLVVISRLRSGRSIFLGGKDHTSHRLLHLGLGIRSVALVLAAACALSTGLGVALGRGALPALPVAAGMSIASVLAVARLLRVPVYEEPALPVPAGALAGGGRRPLVPAGALGAMALGLDASASDVGLGHKRSQDVQVVDVPATLPARHGTTS